MQLHCCGRHVQQVEFRGHLYPLAWHAPDEHTMDGWSGTHYTVWNSSLKLIQAHISSPPTWYPWYHSRSGAQRTDGLFGALIVVRKDNKPDLPDVGDYIDEPDKYTLTLLA